MKEFEILEVKMDGECFTVGEIVIHKNGNYILKIVKFCLNASSPPFIWFYPDENLETVNDLNNFRKIKCSDIENINKLQLLK